MRVNCKLYCQHHKIILTNWPVLRARLCSTSAFLRFICASYICSSNSSMVLEQVQSLHKSFKQWIRHCRCSFSSVLYKDSKIIARSRILSSILLSLCRSTKFNVKSVNGDRCSISLWTWVKVTLSDYFLSTHRSPTIVEFKEHTWSLRSFSRLRM